jgi:iron complex transport system substrate-binding protein
MRYPTLKLLLSRIICHDSGHVGGPFLVFLLCLGLSLLPNLLLYPHVLAQPLDARAPEPKDRAGPQRIISLMPALTETVCLLGACPLLVATDRHSDWPEAVRKLPKLGALDDISLEALIRLKPDLILAHPGGRLNERLKTLGLPLLELRSDNLQDIQQALSAIETRLKLPQAPRAALLWDEAQSAIQAQAKALRLNRNARVYIEVDSALYAGGPKSYLGELLNALGAQNIVPHDLNAFPKLAPEFILAQQPDLVMQLHVGPSPASRPGWQLLKALKAGRLCQWSSEELNILVRPGPRVAQASALMAACLSKTLPVNQPTTR